MEKTMDTLIRNGTQRYHGPALSQGVSALATRQSTAPDAKQLDYVWTIDSDVVILRSDILSHALRAFDDRSVAAVGPAVSDPSYNALLRGNVPEAKQDMDVMFDRAGAKERKKD